MVLATSSLIRVAEEEDGLIFERGGSRVLDDDGDHALVSLLFCSDGLGAGERKALDDDGDHVIVLLLLCSGMGAGEMLLLEGAGLYSETLLRRLSCTTARLRLLLFLPFGLLRVPFNSYWKNVELSESLYAFSNPISELPKYTPPPCLARFRKIRKCDQKFVREASTKA